MRNPQALVSAHRRREVAHSQPDSGPGLDYDFGGADSPAASSGWREIPASCLG